MGKLSEIKERVKALLNANNDQNPPLPAQSTAMRAAQQQWLAMFRGERMGGAALNLPAAVAGEAARLATVELTGTVSGGARAAYLNTCLQPVLQNVRRTMEFAAALGTVVLKPYVDGQGIAVETVLPQNFIPTQINSRGEVTGAVFVEHITRGRRQYTRLERHTRTADGYTVENAAYVSASENTLGSSVPLDSVEEWAHLTPVQRIACADGSAPQGMLFSLVRMPMANHVDTASPLGVSLYSRAEDLIEQANRQYERILWEYEGSELAIDASVGALQTEGDDFRLPRTKQRLFRQLALDGGAGGDLYSVYSPAIRDVSLFNGLNQLLRRIEFACYLSYGTLSDAATQDKTAEEIKMSRQRSYSTVCDMQKGLTAALEQLVRAMDVYATLYGLAPAGPWQCTFACGDAVTQDTDTQRMQMRADVAAGLASAWEYRVKFYGETPQQAKAALTQPAAAPDGAA